MSDYNALYQEVILEHNKKPRNFVVLSDANAYALGKNPLCGDQFAVYVKLSDDDTIEAIGFQGSGCAIAKASASMMTTNVKGKTKPQALALAKAFQAMVTGQEEHAHNDTCVHDHSAEEATAQPDILGRLRILEGVKEYPVRVKCATLSWHTLEAALNGTQEASTEG
jgi:nitrogen fixation protein NifU and related proteins